ncbi:hypothetical protein HIM_11206 [Hirsutella minnesotensis 3608]|uniref:Clr5 domain-containing protein n=1 Tax=Hirsutella minnesotensis 3608 TaxID=1043627 RepID=A0A0F7ZJ89_9HYPO|nr:hypothetical protein HIM_11206 [Hirsutella minnesotensis 3608]
MCQIPTLGLNEETEETLGSSSGRTEAQRLTTDVPEDLESWQRQQVLEPSGTWVSELTPPLQPPLPFWMWPLGTPQRFSASPDEEALLAPTTKYLPSDEQAPFRQALTSTPSDVVVPLTISTPSLPQASLPRGAVSPAPNVRLSHLIDDEILRRSETDQRSVDLTYLDERDRFLIYWRSKGLKWSDFCELYHRRFGSKKKYTYFSQKIKALKFQWTEVATDWCLPKEHFKGKSLAKIVTEANMG